MKKLFFEQLEPRVLLSGSPMPEVQSCDIGIEVGQQENTQIDNQIVSEIAFVDTTVEDYETLIDGLNRNAEIVLVGAEEDGVDKVTSVLQDRDNISAIHIISHGDQGEILLGDTKLNTSSLQNYQSQLKSWSNSLSDSADILIFGCDVGQDLNFIEDLSELTGADVAASDDTTGA